MVAVAVLINGASIAEPASIDFGGSTLQRLRTGSAGNDRFSEYGQRRDGVAETLTVRLISGPATFEAQVGQLVKSIKANNPRAKLKVLQRPNARDVIISYLADRANSNVSLMLWRMIATADNFVATIYQMDFEIEDERARERVTSHAAERALSGYDTAEILDLVSDAK